MDVERSMQTSLMAAPYLITSFYANCVHVRFIPPLSSEVTNTARVGSLIHVMRFSRCNYHVDLF